MTGQHWLRWHKSTTASQDAREGVRTLTHFLGVEDGFTLRRVNVHLHRLGDLREVDVLVEERANADEEAEVSFRFVELTRHDAALRQNMTLRLNVAALQVRHAVVEKHRGRRYLNVFVERATARVDDGRDDVTLESLQESLAWRKAEQVGERAERKHLVCGRVFGGEELDEVHEELRSFHTCAEVLVRFLVT